MLATVLSSVIPTASSLGVQTIDGDEEETCTEYASQNATYDHSWRSCQQRTDRRGVGIEHEGDTVLSVEANRYEERGSWDTRRGDSTARYEYESEDDGVDVETSTHRMRLVRTSSCGQSERTSTSGDGTTETTSSQDCWSGATTPWAYVITSACSSRSHEVQGTSGARETSSRCGQGLLAGALVLGAPVWIETSSEETCSGGECQRSERSVAFVGLFQVSLP